LVDIFVNLITPRDRSRWAQLWRGYLEFYEMALPPEIYEHTWQRLIADESPIRGLGTRLGSATAPLVGMAHYLFHAHAWTMQEVCYLQDLFVDATARAAGVGRRLIEAVAAMARDRGCYRLYRTTKKTMPTRAPSTTGSPVSAASSATITRWNNPRCYAQRYTQGNVSAPPTWRPSGRNDRAEQARRSVASSAACTYSRKNL
jgi:GNAT superfamily N-acetyltransferase